MKILEKIIQYLSYLFIFLLPWQTIFILEERFVNGSKWEYGTLGIYGTEMLGWVLVVLFMGWYVLELRIKNKESGIQFSFSRDRLFVFSLLLFTLYSLLISFIAIETSIVFQHAQRMLLGSLLFLLFYIGPIKPKQVLWAFVLGSVPVSMLGMWQFLMQSTIASTMLGLSAYVIYEPGVSIIASESIGRWLRAYGSFFHPNVFGGYLVFAILSSLMLYCSSVRWGRVLISGIVVIQAAALFFTFSRSAWIAVCIGLVFYLFIVVRGNAQPHLNPPLRKGRELLIPCISIVLLFVVLSLIYAPLVQTRFIPTSQNEIASITERVAGYDQALELFQQHMWLGVGGGNYTYALMQIIPEQPGWWYQPVHNVGVLIVVEYGLVGVLLLAFVLVSFYRQQTIPPLDGIPAKGGTDNRPFVLLIAISLPLLLLDHYLWSSYIGLMFLFVYTALYFRYIEYRTSPHIVPK